MNKCRNNAFTYREGVKKGKKDSIHFRRDQLSYKLLLPGKRKNRVFIGGDYDHLPDLREISRRVELMRKPKFYPVLPFDLLKEQIKEQNAETPHFNPMDIFRNHIHELDIFLVDQCQYAIFEITSSAGQLLELQHAVERANTKKDIDVRCLYKARIKASLGDATRPEHLSSMITTSVKNMAGYHTFSQLDWLVPAMLRPGAVVFTSEIQRKMEKESETLDLAKATALLDKLTSLAYARNKQIMNLLQH